MLIVLTGLLALSMVLAACQPTAPAPATEEPVAAATEEPVAETEAPAELVPVRVGMTPFFDYQFWSVAKEFGWDKDLGLAMQPHKTSGERLATSKRLSGRPAPRYAWTRFRE